MLAHKGFLLFIFSQGLADNTVIAKVNGELWDLDRPFEGDATLQLLKFDDPDGKITSSVTSVSTLYFLLTLHLSLSFLFFIINPYLFL